MFEELSTQKLRFIFLTAVIDYLKANNYRIAAHSLTKTPSPLASRADITPFVEKIKGDQNIDIIGLSPANSIFLAKVIDIPLDQLIAHPYNDENFINAAKTALNIIPTNSKSVEFIFITSGIILPDLILKAEWEQLLGNTSKHIEEKINKFDFLEMRIDAFKLAKMDDQKIYLRNIISRSKWIGSSYKEYHEFNCDVCNRNVWEGSYSLRFWENSLTVPYWICPHDGAQFEAPDTADQASKFIAGFK
jgi:hypothetical protein